MTSKCGKNKKVAQEAQPGVSLMFLPHFDVLCDQLLNRRAATWNLFVLYNKELKSFNDDVIYTSVLQWIISENQSECVYNWTYHINIYIYIYTYIYIFLFVYLSTYIYVFICTFLFFYLSICVCVNLSIYLSICLSIYQSVYMSIYLSIYWLIHLVTFTYIMVQLNVIIMIHLKCCSTMIDRKSCCRKRLWIREKGLAVWTWIDETT